MTTKPRMIYDGWSHFDKQLGLSGMEMVYYPPSEPHEMYLMNQI